MWFCFNDSFLSVVADKDDPARLLVRARRRQDLVNIAGNDVEILEKPERDYRWRTFLPRDQFKALVSARIDQIQYTNFKNSTKNHDLHQLYSAFWERHRKYQQ